MHMVEGQDLSTSSAGLTLGKMKTYLGVDAAQQLAKAYGIREDSPSLDVFWALERMTSLGLYSAPIYFAQDDAVATGSSEIFAYHFNVPSPYENAWGGLAHHSNDNVLTWGVLRHTLPAASQSVVDEMAKAWILFGAGEDPWARHGAGSDKRMFFGEDAKVKIKTENGAWGYDLWEKLRADGLLSDLTRLSDELCLRKSELICHSM